MRFHNEFGQGEIDSFVGSVVPDYLKGIGPNEFEAAPISLREAAGVDSPRQGTRTHVVLERRTETAPDFVERETYERAVDASLSRLHREGWVDADQPHSQKVRMLPMDGLGLVREFALMALAGELDGHGGESSRDTLARMRESGEISDLADVGEMGSALALENAVRSLERADVGSVATFLRHQAEIEGFE